MSFVRMTDLAGLRQTLHDMVGAAVIARTDDEFLQRILKVQHSGGEVPAPFGCWLVLRGVRALPWRMRAHGAFDNPPQPLTF